jgi:hypothetical protein
MRLLKHDLPDPGLGKALDQDLHAPVVLLEHPHDHADRSDRVQIFRFRVILAGILLGQEQKHPLILQGPLEGLHRDLSCDLERDRHVGEDHRIPHGQDRKRFRQLGRVTDFFEFHRFPALLESEGDDSLSDTHICFGSFGMNLKGFSGGIRGQGSGPAPIPQEAGKW